MSFFRVGLLSQGLSIVSVKLTTSCWSRMSSLLQNTSRKSSVGANTTLIVINYAEKNNSASADSLKVTFKPLSHSSTLFTWTTVCLATVLSLRPFAQPPAPPSPCLLILLEGGPASRMAYAMTRTQQMCEATGKDNVCLIVWRLEQGAMIHGVCLG